MMAETNLVADQAVIRAHLQALTRRWDETGEPVMIEMRCLFPNRTPDVQRFSYDAMGLDFACEHAAAMNAAKMNVYVCVNPIRQGTSRGAATDADVPCAFFCFADGDDDQAAANIRNFTGPKHTMAVMTGKIPGPRPHIYYELEEPCRNLPAWTEMQRNIAAALKTDRTVINPSRIMRLAGTINWPTPDKAAKKGRVPELVTLRTDYDDERGPIPFDRLLRVFPSAQASLSAQAASAGASFQIDAGASYAPALDRDRMAIQAMTGQGWHEAVIRLVASYVSRGLSDGEIHALTDPLTLAGYTVEQTRREVQTAIDGARRKGWTPPPLSAVPDLPAPALPTPAPDFDAPQAAPDDKPAVSPFPTEYTVFDAAAVPRRRWIYGQHYLRSFVSVLASAGGVGKTSLQIVEALAIATGKPLLGETVVEPCNVWLVNLEDPLDEMQRRILAAMKFYQIEPHEVAGRLFVDAGRDFALTFAAQTREGVTPNRALVDYLNVRIPQLGIGCVFIDPFVGAHQVNENDNMAVAAVFSQIREVADKAECAIGLVHHIRKGNGEDATIDSVRGAGSLIGAARAARVINRVSVDAAAALGIPAKEAVGLFRLDDGKANLAPPATAAVYRKMVGIQIENGEWIGVASSFKLPDEWEGMDPGTVNEMLRIIDLGIPTDMGEPELYSIRPQDKERWVGNVILNYPFDNKDHQKTLGQAKGIIRAWQNSGLIAETEYTSPTQRKSRKGVQSTGRVGDQE
jgi:hypothetical protein